MEREGQRVQERSTNINDFRQQNRFENVEGSNQGENLIIPEDS